MASPSVTYTFSNSTTADATQVNQNFTDLINGLSDGTKDLSISALTCAGVVTLNGNVTIGNASSDDFTLTASLASSIPIKTTNTYDIGSSTKGLRYAYFGDTADTDTHKVQGQSLAASVTHTLPNYTGTLRQIPTVISSQTATYAILASDEFIPCNVSGGAFTATLPTAVGATGKIYKIKRMDQTLGTALTIATTSAQTIDGSTTTTLDTQYEMLEVMSDGSNWHILRRHIPDVQTAYTPTGTWSSNTTYAATWSRIGDKIRILAKVSLTGAPTGSFTINLPSNLSMDSTKLNTAVGSTVLGTAASNTGASSAHGAVVYDTSTAVYVVHQGGASRWNATTPITWANADVITVEFVAPISGWKG